MVDGEARFENGKLFESWKAIVSQAFYLSFLSCLDNAIDAVGDFTLGIREPCVSVRFVHTSALVPWLRLSQFNVTCLAGSSPPPQEKKNAKQKVESGAGVLIPFPFPLSIAL